MFGLIHALFEKHDFIVPGSTAHLSGVSPFCFVCVNTCCTPEGGSSSEPKVQEYGSLGRQRRQPGEKKWTANATLVEEADEVFREFKSLATSYNPIKGIKKMAIESILFEAHYVEGVRTVKVSYKLVEKEGNNEVAILKRGQTWPERGVLES